MKITTEGIIKALPFDPTFREKLLAELPGLEPDRKADVEQMLWDTYFGLYKLKFDENVQLEMEKAAKENLPLDETFYERVNQVTDKDMMSEFVEGNISVNLDQAREKLEAILENNDTNSSQN